MDVVVELDFVVGVDARGVVDVFVSVLTVLWPLAGREEVVNSTSATDEGAFGSMARVCVKYFLLG